MTAQPHCSLAALHRSCIVIGWILAACAEPTGPEPPASSAHGQITASIGITPERFDFSDAFGRLLPTLSDTRLASELRTSLARFEAAHALNDRVAAQRAIDDANVLLARSNAHVVNLGALRLSIRRAQEAVDKSDRSSIEDR